MTIISESCLYACILKSRRAEAKRFRKWVTSEVLPALRKTSRYALPDAPSISPAQQRLIRNAIAERFPDGKFLQVSEIEPEAMVATGAQIVRLVGEPGIVDRAELPSLIEAAAKRLRTA